MATHTSWGSMCSGISKGAYSMHIPVGTIWAKKNRVTLFPLSLGLIRGRQQRQSNISVYTWHLADVSTWVKGEGGGRFISIPTVHLSLVLYKDELSCVDLQVITECDECATESGGLLATIGVHSYLWWRPRVRGTPQRGSPQRWGFRRWLPCSF